MARRGRRHDERGIALSSPVALLSTAAVVLAGAAYVATGHHRQPTAAADPVATASRTVSPMPSPASKAPRPVVERHRPAKAKPAVRRGGVFVEVYNNSGVKGLAGRTSRRASGAGWNVVGSDNWYGTIPASTVYYPQRLTTQARLLARDLGIHRLRPAIAPMRFDRLTVILTRDYA